MKALSCHLGNELGNAHVFLAEVEKDEYGSDDRWLLIAAAFGAHDFEAVMIVPRQMLKLELAHNVSRALVGVMTREDG